MTFHSMSPYYKNVLDGDMSPLINRHVTFPNLVLTCALNDGRIDVASNLLDLGYKCDFFPAWKNVWISNSSSTLGMTPNCIETNENKLTKFKTCKFLIDRELYSVDQLIPRYLNDDWLAFLGDDEKDDSLTSSQEFNPAIAIIFFVILLVVLNLIINLCF